MQGSGLRGVSAAEVRLAGSHPGEPHWGWEPWGLSLLLPSLQLREGPA